MMCMLDETLYLRELELEFVVKENSRILTRVDNSRKIFWLPFAVERYGS